MRILPRLFHRSATPEPTPSVASGPASETRALGDDLLTLFGGGLPSATGITISTATAMG